ncbi:superoxide dismutase[Cu-Zn] [Williamsia sterculiae]|uniref:Superoxide dismutase, Cu-Zn family n=1 Tax=Williamsia sterculiae TaxID=1344003 RepID=A0A1N7F0F8_9NOCA|nr:superoxide dismutase family protein [Williamsia sterculiae]SIR93873.1 superoxide dismutase, Cu-Zn family [Williamsia sterculiae]
MTHRPLPRHRSLARPVGRAALLLATVSAAGLALAGCGNGEEASSAEGTTPAVTSGVQAPIGQPGENGAQESTGTGAAKLTASLINPTGNQIGTAEFATAGDGVQVTVSVRKDSGLSAGFHGVHLHTNGVCENNSTAPTGGAPGAFLSAGGHLQVNGRTEHPSSGDLTSIFITSDGSGELTTTTDMVTVPEITGKSIMIHSGADNFGNIPTRYAPTPDKETLSTGDAGSRAACGVLTAE